MQYDEPLVNSPLDFKSSVGVIIQDMVSLRPDGISPHIMQYKVKNNYQSNFVLKLEFVFRVAGSIKPCLMTLCHTLGAQENYSFEDIQIEGEY